jgi:hypothetical protein
MAKGKNSRVKKFHLLVETDDFKDLEVKLETQFTFSLNKWVITIATGSTIVIVAFWERLMVWVEKFMS